MSSNPPNTNPTPSGSPSGSGGAPAAPMTPELRQLLEKEIGFAKLLDYVVHEPFELTFQKQLIQTYEQQLVIPLMEGTSPLGNLDAGRIRLKSLYDQLEIAKKMSAIIAEAEVVCRANKIKEPIQKKSSKISMITMTVVMVAYFVLLSLPGLAGYSQYIMIPLLLVICFLPQLLKSVLEKKWNTFKELNKGPLQEAQRANMTDVKVYIQEILNDCKQYELYCSPKSMRI
jgi:hypothetical protein